MTEPAFVQEPLARLKRLLLVEQGSRKLLDLASLLREEDLRVVRLAGYDDAQVIEIVLHAALNTWTNYINVVAGTDIDFPVVNTRKAA